MSDAEINKSNDLNNLQLLCDNLLNKMHQLDDLQQKEKDLKEEIRQISEDTIPSILEELGLEKIILKSGETISTKMDVSASISKDNLPVALEWLDNHGYGDLIKTKTVIYFTREEREAALKKAEELSNEGYDVILDENVHPMTLKSWIKERLSDGDDIPLDIFGARQFYKTTITKPKIKK